MTKPEKSEREMSYLTKNSLSAKLCLFATASSLTILIGYHFSAMNPATPALHTVFNETYRIRYNTSLPASTWTTLLTLSGSSPIIGAFFAALTGNFFLVCMSPKRMIQVLHVINIFGTLIITLGAGLTRSYEVFICGRLVTGYPCGALFVVVPAMLAEISERSQQNLFQSVFGLSISFGMFLGILFGHPKILGRVTLWPVLFSLAIIPSILYIIASVKFRDSPYYYIRAGMREEAKSTMKHLRIGSEESIKRELQTIENEINKNGSGIIGIRQILSTLQYRNQLIGVICLFANLMLCGINNILIYSSIIFIEAGMDPNTASFASVGIFGGQFVAACFGPKIVDKLGGVRVNMLANILLILSLVVFTITQALQSFAPDILPYISVAAIAVFMIAFSGGLNIATYVIISEITIEPTRLTCMTYGNLVLWFCSWFVGFIPPYLQLGLGHYAMVPWIVCGILGLLYMCICLPNTKGKSREQIQRRLSSKISLSSLRSTKPLTE